jgi:transcription antitermination protein NusB
MMLRRKEREFALKVLYALMFNDISSDKQAEYLKQSEPEFATKFSFDLISKCAENKEDLDALIRDKLKHWDLKRVAIIDRVLLRMALAEFLYFEDIPPKVTIDEIIEIGKEYSTEKSSQFINGILDALFKQLDKENKIKKTGRGLITNIDKKQV